MSKTIRVDELVERLRFEGGMTPGSEHVSLDRVRSEAALTACHTSTAIVAWREAGQPVTVLRRLGDVA